MRNLDFPGADDTEIELVGGIFTRRQGGWRELFRAAIQPQEGMRPAAVSWGIAEPEVVREWIINVRAHPDLTPVLAKYAFFGHLAHRHQFDLRLILMGNHDFFALFC